MFRTIGILTLLGVVGLVVAVITTAAHRFAPPWGVIMAFALVLSTAVFARAWARFAGVAAFGLVWATTAVALAVAKGPGGSVVVLDDGLGRAYLFGAVAAVIVAAVVPTSVFEGEARVEGQA